MNRVITYTPPIVREPQYPCAVEVNDEEIGKYYAVIWNQDEFKIFWYRMEQGGPRVMAPLHQRDWQLPHSLIQIETEPEIVEFEAYKTKKLIRLGAASIITLMSMTLKILGFDLAVMVLALIGGLPAVTLVVYWEYWALSNDYEVLNPSKHQHFFCSIGFVPTRDPSYRFYRNIVVKNKSI